MKLRGLSKAAIKRISQAQGRTITVELPLTIEADDYHELDALRETLEFFTGETINLEETDFDSGIYRGILY